MWANLIAVMVSGLAALLGLFVIFGWPFRRDARGLGVGFGLLGASLCVRAPQPGLSPYAGLLIAGLFAVVAAGAGRAGIPERRNALMGVAIGLVLWVLASLLGASLLSSSHAGRH